MQKKKNVSCHLHFIFSALFSPFLLFVSIRFLNASICSLYLWALHCCTFFLVYTYTVEFNSGVIIPDPSGKSKSCSIESTVLPKYLLFATAG